MGESLGNWNQMQADGWGVSGVAEEGGADDCSEVVSAITGPLF